MSILYTFVSMLYVANLTIQRCTSCCGSAGDEIPAVEHQHAAHGDGCRDVYGQNVGSENGDYALSKEHGHGSEGVKAKEQGASLEDYADIIDVNAEQGEVLIWENI